MQFRELGNSGVRLSTIGLGTWAIGGGDWKFGWGDQDESAAIQAIVRSVEVGINWIDTAAIYGEGKSEELVGRALKTIPKNQRPLIATKCGRVPLGNGEIAKVLKRESIIAECEASLRRLQIDCIDLYQMHWPEPDEDIEEGWQTLVELKNQGKVRHIGVSNHNVSQLQRLQAIHPVDSLQPPYSMLARRIEEEILTYCKSSKIGVVAYSPMGKGLLTGTFTRMRAQSLAANDHRSRDPRFQPPELEINLAMVESLQCVANDLGWTLPELAIAWVLRDPGITSAIVGARSPQQISETARAGDCNLPATEAARIESILKARDAQIARLSA